jgi:hypothetical protein
VSTIHHLMLFVTHQMDGQEIKPLGSVPGQGHPRTHDLNALSERDGLNCTGPTPHSPKGGAPSDKSYPTKNPVALLKECTRPLDRQKPPPHPNGPPEHKVKLTQKKPASKLGLKPWKRRTLRQSKLMMRPYRYIYGTKCSSHRGTSRAQRL